VITGASIIDGNTAIAEVYRTSGTGFGGDFDPESFTAGDVVGTVMFEFDDCDFGAVTFTSANTAVLADFSNDIQRLSNIAGRAQKGAGHIRSNVPRPLLKTGNSFRTYSGV